MCRASSRPASLASGTCRSLPPFGAPHRTTRDLAAGNGTPAPGGNPTEALKAGANPTGRNYQPSTDDLIRAAFGRPA